MQDSPPTGAEIEIMLKALPVRPENAEKLVAIRRRVAELAEDRDLWRREWEMYARAWLRELGGRVFGKRHHIDALVLTTRHVYRWYLHGLAHHGFSDNCYVEPPRPPREMVAGDIGLPV